MRSPVAAWSCARSPARIVGDELDALARPADLDVEALLHCRVRVSPRRMRKVGKVVWVLRKA